MSTVYLIPENEPALDVIGFDVTISESHSEASDPTEFPVEGGATISDHVIDQPARFSCVVLVTETPHTPNFFGDSGDLEAEASVPVFVGGGIVIPATLRLRGVGKLDPNKSLVRDMFDRLTKLRKEKILLTVLTSAREYEGMLLVSIEFPREERSLGRGRFSLAFRELETVSTATVDAPKPKEPRGEKLKAKGAQSKKETDAKTKGNLKSWAKGIVDGDLSVADAANNLLGIGPQ